MTKATGRPRQLKVIRFEDIKADLLWAKVDIRGPDECWLWLAGKDRRSGYGRFGVKGSNIHAHRAVWMLHNHSSLSSGDYVLHSCDVRLCCNRKHLFIGDHAANMKDMKDKGRARGPTGEVHWMVKLSDDDVRAILRSPIRRHLPVAEQFGITRAHVSHIRIGRTRHDLWLEWQAELKGDVPRR